MTERQFSPSTIEILKKLKEIWPEYHQNTYNRFIKYSEKQLSLVNELSDKILAVKKGEVFQLVQNFKQVCEMLLEEEIYFRRHGKYRLGTEKEAFDEVYSNSSLMSAYLDGLLLSQLLWDNHFRVYEKFLSEFLPLCSNGRAIMEIGPGHGFFIALAAEKKKVSCVGVDISEESIEYTRASLMSLGLRSKCGISECRCIPLKARK